MEKAHIILDLKEQEGDLMWPKDIQAHRVERFGIKLVHTMPESAHLLS